MKIKVCPVKPTELGYVLAITTVVVGMILAIAFDYVIVIQIAAVAILFTAGFIAGAGSHSYGKDVPERVVGIGLTMICVTMVTVLIVGIFYSGSELHSTEDVVRIIVSAAILNAAFLIGYFARWVKDCVRIVPDDNFENPAEDVKINPMSEPK